MTRSWLPAAMAALVLGAYEAEPAWAVACLDDAGDAAQVEAARAAVDASCKCFGTTSHGEYVRCASSIVRQRVEMMLLRKECQGTAKRIYATSVCGRDLKRATPGRGPRVACVSQKVSSGEIDCAIRPIYSCDSSANQQRQECLAHTHCLDAADTNDDLEIAYPDDSGDCATLADTLTDNGDGTITDSRTSLMWEKLSDDGSVHDWNDVYTWSDAFAVKIATLNSGGGFAGYTDWRLPTIHELMTLARIGLTPSVPLEFNGACVPGCSVLACSCTADFLYWSATEEARPNAWAIAFLGGGHVLADDKPQGLYVRAVRGGS
jgi:hypothetical protein